MITVGQDELDALVASGAKIRVEVPQVKTPAPPSELAQILRALLQSNATQAAALKQLTYPQPMVASAPPAVHVAAPSVSLSPSIQVERPSRWRFIVTKRDPLAQNRIQEIVAEIIQ